MKDFIGYQTFPLAVNQEKAVSGDAVTTIAVFSVKTGAGVASEVSVKVGSQPFFPMEGRQVVSFEKPVKSLVFKNTTAAAVTVRVLLGDADVNFGGS